MAKNAKTSNRAATAATVRPGKPSAELDTRAIYCGDCLEKLADLPDHCIDLIYIDLPFSSSLRPQSRRQLQPRNYDPFPQEKGLTR